MQKFIHTKLYHTTYTYITCTQHGTHEKRKGALTGVFQAQLDGLRRKDSSHGHLTEQFLLVLLSETADNYVTHCDFKLAILCNDFPHIMIGTMFHCTWVQIT